MKLFRIGTVGLGACLCLGLMIGLAPGDEKQRPEEQPNAVEWEDGAAGEVRGEVVIRFPDGTLRRIPLGGGNLPRVRAHLPPGQPLGGPVGVMVQRQAKDGAEREYGLGVSLAREVPGALRAHLDLPENAGLLVQSVADESPAAKAGLKEHDILLKLDDEPLQSADALIEAIQTAGKEGKELSLEVLSAGEKEILKLKPEKASKMKWLSEIQGDALELTDPLLHDNLNWEDLHLRLHPGVVVPGPQASNERLQKLEREVEKLTRQLQELQQRLPAPEEN